MTVWDEYFARYRELLVWSPEVDDDDQYEDQHKAIEESLVADFSPHPHRRRMLLGSEMRWSTNNENFLLRSFFRNHAEFRRFSTKQ